MAIPTQAEGCFHPGTRAFYIFPLRNHDLDRDQGAAHAGSSPFFSDGRRWSMALLHLKIIEAPSFLLASSFYAVEMRGPSTSTVATTGMSPGAITEAMGKGGMGCFMAVASPWHHFPQISCSAADDRTKKAGTFVWALTKKYPLCSDCQQRAPPPFPSTPISDRIGGSSSTDGTSQHIHP